MDAAKLLRIEHMLERKPAGMSGGQRQRVAIGRAIVRQPMVFRFDEPLHHAMEEVTPALWEDRLALNLKHHFFAIQTVAPSISQAGGGAVINTG